MFQETNAPGGLDAAPVEDEVLDALVKARDAITLPENWCHGGGGFGTHMACAIVAIQRAIGFEGYSSPLAPKAQPVYRAFLEANGIAFSTGDLEGWVSEWNDAPDRTHSEVLAAFVRAIAARRLGGNNG